MIPFIRLLSVLYFVCVFSTIFGLRSYVIEIDYFHKEFNESLFNNVTLELINVDNRKVINGSIWSRILIDQFDLYLIVSIPRKNGRTSTLLNLTINGCDFIASRFSGYSQLSHVLMNYIRKSTQNVPKKCPMKQGTQLIFKNLYVDAEQLPPYFPEVKYSSVFGFNYKKHLGYKLTVNGSITSREKKKFGWNRDAKPNKTVI